MSKRVGTPGDSRATLETIHDTVRSDGENELQRSNAALAYSGIAAGMAMTFSLITEGLLHHYLPDQPWRPAVSNVGYSVGFLIVILGRQQLFTENTLTVVIPFLHDRTLQTFGHIVRVWSIVLLSNLIGGAGVAMVLANTQSFDPEIREAFCEIGRSAIDPGFSTILLRGVYAGWLIALLVWILPATGSAKLWAIVIFAYVIGLAHFSHVIAGSIEVFYLAAEGSESWLGVLFDYSLPALIGNVLGGVLLTALINHAQVVADK